MRARILTPLMALVIMAVPNAFGQTVGGTTGAITGKVADESGAVMPGVTVTVTSQALQGARTAVTGPDGTYLFQQVPPGTYRANFELAGFETVMREGVSVGLGLTATINVSMKLGSLSETLTVTGASPVVDVTATKTTTIFDSATIAAVPNSRDIWALLAVTPSVQMQRIDVGGSTAASQTGYSSYDTQSNQHRPLIEGLVMTEGTSGAGMFYDQGAIDQAAITTAGMPAEMPTPGIFTQIVFKSGGDIYTGHLYIDKEAQGLQSHNIDPSDTALCPSGRCLSVQPQDLNRNLGHYDFNSDIGGFITKDTLWWYFSGRLQDFNAQKPNLAIPYGGLTMQNAMGKVTYSANKNNKFTGFAMVNHLHDVNRLDTYLISAAVARHSGASSTWDNYWWTHLYKASWENVISSTTFLDVVGGQYKYNFFCNSYAPDMPAFADLATNVVSGGNQDGWATIPARNQALATLSKYKEGWAGSHNFKLGGEWLRETYTFLRGDRGNPALPNNAIQVLNNGNPSQVYLFQSPSESQNGLYTFSGFAQDTWKMSNRVTLNVGVRVDHYRAFLPAQEGPTGGWFNVSPPSSFAAINNVISWTLPAPRIGAIYDVSGDGKNVLKVNGSMYWWNPGTNISQNVNANPPNWYHAYSWADKNANGLWDPGEQGQLISQAGGVGSAVIDPNAKDQRTDELSTFFEHELMPSVALRGGYVYRRINNFLLLVNANRPYGAFNVPLSVTDPGPDGRLGNADDGGVIQAYNLNPAYLSLPVVNTETNLPGTATFHNVEVSMTKRPTGRWSLQSSFAYHWNRAMDTGYFGNTLRGTAAPANPNDTINTDGGRYDFTTWSAHVVSPVEVGWGLRVTPTLRLQSGQSFGRFIVAQLNYGAQRILTEPMDAERQANVVLLDARVERQFVMHQQKVAVFLDAFNITNANTAVNETWSSGASYLLPSVIVAPRILRFGAKFDW